MSLYFLNTENEDSLIKLINDLKLLKPGEYNIEVKPKKGIRKLNHNAYYWGYIITPVADFLGYDKELKQKRKEMQRQKHRQN